MKRFLNRYKKRREKEKTGEQIIGNDDLLSIQPDEILWCICEQLDYVDLLHLAQCSRRLDDLCSDEELLASRIDTIQWSQIRCYRIENFEEKFTIVKPIIGGDIGGTLYVCRNKRTKEEFMVKSFDSLSNSSDSFDKYVRRELETRWLVHLRGPHKNIISFKDIMRVEKKGEKAFVVSETIEEDLFERLLREGPFCEEMAAFLVYAMLDAIAFLHRHGVMHRDIKTEVFAFTDKTYRHLKLFDFGFCRCGPVGSSSCGTPDYAAPELLTGYDYANLIDIWSMGVVVYILLCAFPPFYADTQQQLFEKIMKVDYAFVSPEWDSVSDEAKEFIRDHLLVMDPSKRATAEEAMRHSWLEKRHLVSEEQFTMGTNVKRDVAKDDEGEKKDG